MADLPPAQGRLFADIDILVPKAALARTESTLMLHGWISSHHSAYDQRYYRRWMHELPPMTHIRRKSQLDVHHNLLPETARLRTHPDRVIAASQPIPGFQSLCVPSLEDLVLHSATHLFHEGEWGHGLRDLVDLDALLRHGMSRTNWWDDLLRRGRDLGLTGPLGLALRYSAKLLHTPVPERIIGGNRAACVDGIRVRSGCAFPARLRHRPSQLSLDWQRLGGVRPFCPLPCPAHAPAPAASPSGL